MRHAEAARRLVLLALWVGFAARAAGAGGAASAPSADGPVWLERIHAAAATGNFEGTMVLSAGGALSTSRVSHYAVGGQIYEQLETLDGRQQRILRHDQIVQTLWPQRRVAVIETRQTLAGWSTTPQQVDPQALGQYALRREADGRVAGRDAAVFLLEPRDLLRYAQRLWADLATGLMLRADVLGVADGAEGSRPVLESAAFSEVSVGVRPKPDTVLGAMIDPRHAQGYRLLRPQQQPTTLDAEHWVLARPVSGFMLAGCLRRIMGLGGEDSPVLQAVFTDGLTHVSLFVEAFRPQYHQREMQAQRGATATLTQRRGDFWFTAVGDVPPATLRLFATAFERRPR